VFLDDTPVLGWTAYPIELNDISKITSNIVTRRRMYESGVEAMTSDPDLAEGPQVGGTVNLCFSHLFSIMELVTNWTASMICKICMVFKNGWHLKSILFVHC
jgi:hypothetical protein